MQLLLFCSVPLLPLSRLYLCISSQRTAQIPTALRKSKELRVFLIPERFSDETLT